MRSKGEGDDDSEPDSDDDEDEEDDDEEGDKRKRARGRKKEGDKYMAPAEVQMHLKLLWETETKLATLIWGRSFLSRSSLSSSRQNQKAAAIGWKTFFWRVLPVAPSRFRPPSRSDDGSLAEHPQNHNLIKVCVCR